MKRKILLAGALSMLLIASGCANRMEGDKAGTEQAPNAVPVEVELLQKSMIKEEFYSLGAVEPSRTYTMNALINADVKKVYVQVGDTVKEGDLLFELETSDFNTNKTSQLSSAKTQLDSAKIKKDSSQKSYDDTKILFDQGAVSKSALDQSKDALDSAVLSYNNALTAYNTTRTSLSSSEENYLVTSPIDGIVTGRSVEAGQFATSQNGITVAQYSPVKIQLTIPSAKIDKAYVGQPVHVVFPAQDNALDARLTALNLSGQAGGYPAEVEIDNTDKMLLPGMVAEIYLETGRTDNAFVIDKNTLLEDDEGQYVYVVRDNKAVRVHVNKGIENGRDIEIKGDLTDMDKVVVKGQQYLDDGVSVSLSPDLDDTSEPENENVE